jgi:hypothetical protein
METVLAHPALRELRRFVLVTRDAHALYERYGFGPLSKPGTYMEITRPGIYRPGVAAAPKSRRPPR